MAVGRCRPGLSRKVRSVGREDEEVGDDRYGGVSGFNFLFFSLIFLSLWPVSEFFLSAWSVD